MAPYAERAAAGGAGDRGEGRRAPAGPGPALMMSMVLLLSLSENAIAHTRRCTRGLRRHHSPVRCWFWAQNAKFVVQAFFGHRNA